MKKCEKCQKVAELQAKIDRLQWKIDEMKDAPYRSKVHFSPDGYYTLCGKELFGDEAQDLDVTDDLDECTCKLCRNEWRKVTKEEEK